MNEFEVQSDVQDYYDRMTWSIAIDAIRTKVEEWKYEDDPHGYCHERPALMMLLTAVSSSTPPESR